MVLLDGLLVMDHRHTSLSFVHVLYTSSLSSNAILRLGVTRSDYATHVPRWHEPGLHGNSIEVPCLSMSTLERQMTK